MQQFCLTNQTNIEQNIRNKQNQMTPPPPKKKEDKKDKDKKTLRNFFKIIKVLCIFLCIAYASFSHLGLNHHSVKAKGYSRRPPIFLVHNIERHQQTNM